MHSAYWQRINRTLTALAVHEFCPKSWTGDVGCDDTEGLKPSSPCARSHRSLPRRGAIHLVKPAHGLTLLEASEERERMGYIDYFVYLQLYAKNPTQTNPLRSMAVEMRYAKVYSAACKLTCPDEYRLAKTINSERLQERVFRNSTTMSRFSQLENSAWLLNGRGALAPTAAFATFLRYVEMWFSICIGTLVAAQWDHRVPRFMGW